MYHPALQLVAGCELVELFRGSLAHFIALDPPPTLFCSLPFHLSSLPFLV